MTTKPVGPGVTATVVAPAWEAATAVGPAWEAAITLGPAREAAATLGAAGLAVQWHLAPGMGHGIDEKGLSLAGNFLALALAGRLGTQGPLCCPL